MVEANASKLFGFGIPSNAIATVSNHVGKYGNNMSRISFCSVPVSVVNALTVDENAVSARLRSAPSSPCLASVNNSGNNVGPTVATSFASISPAIIS